LSRARVTLSRLEKAGRAGEDAVLVIILTAMILLAASQIVMRNFFNFGFIWTDEMLRMLVLWIAVAGAVAASRNDKHINIAILDRFLPDRIKQAVKIAVHLFTAAVCGVVAWHSVQFVLTSREFGDVLMGSIPAWLPQLILPIGFGLICYRYALFMVKEILRLVRAGEPQ
jgi:TRAP-type C4-dicarboxylate transport system permease small subunit